MIEMLLAAGADPSLTNNDSKTSADLARDNGHNALAEKLKPNAG